MSRLPHNGYGVMRRFALSLVLVVCSLGSMAQTPEEEFHVSKYFTDEFRPMIEADSSVFYRLLQRNEDAFAGSADYDLSFVGFARRGVDRKSVV